MPPDENKIANISKGLEAACKIMREKAPEATIILMGIFPRNHKMALLPAINKIHDNLSKLADGKKTRYLNINEKLADADGKLFVGMMNPDKLHPAIKGYQVWADALKPIFHELLGPLSARSRSRFRPAHGVAGTKAPVHGARSLLQSRCAACWKAPSFISWKATVQAEELSPRSRGPTGKDSPAPAQ